MSLWQKYGINFPNLIFFCQTVLKRMNCESDNEGMYYFQSICFRSLDHKKNQWSKKQRKEATDSLWQLSVKLPVKGQCFSKISFRIIYAALLRCVALLCDEYSREYCKVAPKPSFKEIKTSLLTDVASKFRLNFNKFDKD